MDASSRVLGSPALPMLSLICRVTGSARDLQIVAPTRLMIMIVVDLPHVTVHAAMVIVTEALLAAVTTMIGEDTNALHQGLVGLWMITPHLPALVAMRIHIVVTIHLLLLII